MLNRSSWAEEGEDGMLDDKSDGDSMKEFPFNAPLSLIVNDNNVE